MHHDVNAIAVLERFFFTNPLVLLCRVFVWWTNIIITATSAPQKQRQVF